MFFIEPGREVCKKAVHWKVKRPSTIAAACPKQIGLIILRPDLVFIGTKYLSLSLSPSRAILDLELLFCQLLAPTCSLWGDRFISIELEFSPTVWSEGELLFTVRSLPECSVGELLFTLWSPSKRSVGELLFTLRSPSEWSVGELLFTLWSTSKRPVRVFHCFPILNWNFSGESSQFLLKRLSKLYVSLFVFLALVVVKSSSKTMFNCGKIFTVLIFWNRATLPAWCGNIQR